MTKGLFGRVQSELDAREKTAGVSMADILDMPESLRGLVNWIMRENQVELAQVSKFLNQDEQFARSMLASLLDKGYIKEIEIKGCTFYRIRLAPKRKKNVPSNVWSALDGKVEGE